MSQFVVDDQLALGQVLEMLQKRFKAQRLQHLRPGELILDERVPEILLTIRQPTFVTIDNDFWDRRFCHPDYAILYFALRTDQQGFIPDLLRTLLHKPEFRTRAVRMGKVARVHPDGVDFWQYRVSRRVHLAWD
jgi:hypothetical protein